MSPPTGSIRMLFGRFVLPAAFSAALAAAAAAADPPSLAARVEQELQDLIARIAPAAVTVAEGGSGVLVSPDGWILTNFHVAGAAPASEVGIPGRGKFLARRIGVDRQGDICLLKVDSPPEEPFACAAWGDSDALQVGQWAVALGNPFMTAQTTYQPSASLGIVSGLRRFNAQGGGFVYGDCIQHDAAINPGNSGGPLFDAGGRLIGINGKIEIRRGRVNSGIGYAIPINYIRSILDDLKAGREIEHGWSGIQDARDEARRQGARIAAISPGSPADRAGLKVGDIVVRVGERQVREVADLLNALWPHRTGQKVAVGVARGGAPLEVVVTLAKPPPPQRPPDRGLPPRR